MKEKLLTLYKNSVFQNSLYPILATAVMAGFGFFFWLFSARLFSSEEVGLAATLISVMVMMSTLSLMGFDTATIRFLARETHKNESINTGMTIIGLVAFMLSGLFVFFVDLISPHLSFIRTDLFIAFAFVLFSILSALNMYTDAIFLAYRKTKFTFVIDTIFSVVKVTLPFAFVPWGAFGIFAAAAVAQAVGLILSIGILMRHFGYRPMPMIHRATVARVWKYSAGNYTADILNLLPLTLLPIIIINHLGPAQSAYYYIVMMIAGLLYVIPASAMNALFAEGSHNEEKIPASIRDALRVTVLLLAPAMFVLFAGGKLILSLFGAEYSASGLSFLYVMTLAATVVTFYTLYGSLFRLTHNIKALIFRNLSYTASTLTLVYLLLPYGLVGVGGAYIGGNIVGGMTGYFLFRRHARMSADTFASDLASRLRPGHMAHVARNLFNEHVLWPAKTTFEAKRAYLRARRGNGYTPITVLFYPERPKTYHVLYKVCHLLGWKIITNPHKPANVRICFKDITIQNTNPTLAALRAQHTILNIDCNDISKTKVDEVFRDVFGYGMSLDPRTHTGTCVRKSDTNAVHDGKVVTCPIEPEEGYVYQKLINTACDNDRVMDLRISIFHDTIALTLKRYKSTSDIFNITIAEEFADTDEMLSGDEQTKVIAFCKKMGLDYGEIDALRSHDDGRLYIVDVNNTPAGPIGPLYENKENLERWFKIMCDATKKALLPPQAT